MKQRAYTNELADEDEDDVPLPKLMSDLDRITGTRCGRCEHTLCGHEGLVAIVLGQAARPLCIACLAEGLGTDASELAAGVFAHVRRRDCFSKACSVASEREGFGAGVAPVCVFAVAAIASAGELEPGSGAAADRPAATDRWDAGDKGCGELVLELFMRLKAAPAGTVLALRATDLAAPLDIPAWCSLTGNRLVYAAPPEYLIAKKES